MKKLGIMVLALLMFSATGCIKDIEKFDLLEQLELEKPIIQQYVEANIPNAIYDENTSIWYEVLEVGQVNSYEYKLDVLSGLVVSPTITVNYTGKLLNGETFDSNQSAAGAVFNLGSLVVAWQCAFLPNIIDGRQTIGLTEMGLQKGSEIRIVTPSYFGYQNNQHGTIPANSPLDFTIKVMDIK